MDSQLTLQINSRKQELLEARFQGVTQPLQLGNKGIIDGVNKMSTTVLQQMEMSDQSGGSVSADSRSPDHPKEDISNSITAPYTVPTADNFDIPSEIIPSVELTTGIFISSPLLNCNNYNNVRKQRPKFRKRRAEESSSEVCGFINRHKRIDDYLFRRDVIRTVSLSKSPSPASFLNEDSNSSQNSCSDTSGLAIGSTTTSGRLRFKHNKVSSASNTSQRNQDKNSTSFQLSPVRNYNSASNSSASNHEWTFHNRSVQTDLSHIHIQQLEKASAEDRHEDAELLDLQRQLGDMDKRIMAQQKLIHQLRDHQDKSKEMIKKLLIEKADLERKATRQTCMENRLRLGQFQTIRHGSHLEEKWLDGFAFREIEKRKQEIESERDRIEKDKKNWQKRKPGSAKSGAAAAKRDDAADNMSAEEFFVQLEIYEQRRMGLLKEEKELKEEQEKMDRERNLHIRELKRIQNEDSSRFRDHIILHQRYLLLCLLGKGGFSEVHKGYDLNEQRYVACKIHQLNANWPKDKKENYIRHAVREIAIHKTLVHSRIVRVYDVFDIDPDSFCTVLEYNRGNDLDFYLKQNKALSEREGKNIISQVVSALKYLNQRKPPVIHYDLKPGNILLGSNEGAGEIKITDFGLSKLMEEDTYNPELGMELTSQGAGTYWYLPPECFETGNELPRISSKVDVWSVGVIFFQCLYGRKPFGHNQSQADILHNNTILQARTIEFPGAAPGNTKISEQAKKFIQRCCTYNKFHRPDVFQLAEDDYLKSKAQLKSSSSTVFTMPLPPPPMFDGVASVMLLGNVASGAAVLAPVTTTNSNNTPSASESILSSAGVVSQSLTVCSTTSASVSMASFLRPLSTTQRLSLHQQISTGQASTEQ